MFHAFSSSAMKRKRRSTLLTEDDGDPLSVVVNLFDVAMVFAVALMVAMVMNMNMTEIFSGEDFTMVKNPGREDMEIIRKEGKKIEKYKASSPGRFRTPAKKKNGFQ